MHTNSIRRKKKKRCKQKHLVDARGHRKHGQTDKEDYSNSTTMVSRKKNNPSDTTCQNPEVDGSHRVSLLSASNVNPRLDGHGHTQTGHFYFLITGHLTAMRFFCLHSNPALFRTCSANEFPIGAVKCTVPPRMTCTHRVYSQLCVFRFSWIGSFVNAVWFCFRFLLFDQSKGERYILNKHNNNSSQIIIIRRKRALGVV